MRFLSEVLGKESQWGSCIRTTMRFLNKILGQEHQWGSCPRTSLWFLGEVLGQESQWDFLSRARNSMRFLGKKLVEILAQEPHWRSWARTSMSSLIPGKILNEFLGKDLNEFVFQFFVRKVILLRSKNQAEFSIGILMMFLYCSFLKLSCIQWGSYGS